VRKLSNDIQLAKGATHERTVTDFMATVGEQLEYNGWKICQPGDLVKGTNILDEALKYHDFIWKVMFAEKTGPIAELTNRAMNSMKGNAAGIKQEALLKKSRDTLFARNNYSTALYPSALPKTRKSQGAVIIFFLVHVHDQGTLQTALSVVRGSMAGTESRSLLRLNVDYRRSYDGEVMCLKESYLVS
jgi:hypothetical protein